MSVTKDDAVALKEMHQLTQLLQHLDVGVIVIDSAGNVQSWNQFMASHSGLRASQVRGKSLFELFDSLPVEWLQRKLETVKTLKARVYSNWQQQPYVFPLPSYRPITGKHPLMRQNLTFLPLLDTNKTVESIGILVYDASELSN